MRQWLKRHEFFLWAVMGSLALYWTGVLAGKWSEWATLANLFAWSWLLATIGIRADNARRLVGILNDCLDENETEGKQS